MTERTIKCTECPRLFATHETRRAHQMAKHSRSLIHDEDIEPDWEGECDVCG